MFEMKNEGDLTATKQKNDDLLKELDKDRTETIPANPCSTRYVVMDKHEIRGFVATRKIMRRKSIRLKRARPFPLKLLFSTFYKQTWRGKSLKYLMPDSSTSFGCIC